MKDRSRIKVLKSYDFACGFYLYLLSGCDRCGKYDQLGLLPRGLNTQL